MQGYFLAIGELLADIISTDYCESLSHATMFQLVQGGSPANVAANVKYLGGAAKLVSCVGNDGVGKSLIKALKKTALSTNDIQIHKSEPTSLILISKSKNTPDFIAYRHADVWLQPIDDNLLKGAAVIHSTAFALSKQPAQNVILAAMNDAFSNGKTVSVDWNFAPQIWGADSGREVFQKLLKLKPLLKASIDDLERFEGRQLSIEQCKNLMGDYNTKATCLTCGKDGVWFKTGGQEWNFLPALQVPQVVDVTGAGDAFWAGFIVDYMNDVPVEDCVQKGLETAAKKIQKTGPLYSQ